MATDRVCGAKIDEKKAEASYEYQGRTFYFCAEDCRDKFIQSPEQFLKNGGKK